jgi:hypothetical protein
VQPSLGHTLKVQLNLQHSTLLCQRLESSLKGSPGAPQVHLMQTLQEFAIVNKCWVIDGFFYRWMLGWWWT